MPSPGKFSSALIAALRDAKSVRLRAGGRHRFIGIWVVVVEDRAFVRSWSLKPRGWYRALLADPRGSIQLAERTVAIHAIRTRSARLKAAVDRAYLGKYATSWELKYAKDLTSPRSRASTIELRPVRSGGPTRP